MERKVQKLINKKLENGHKVTVEKKGDITVMITEKRFGNFKVFGKTTSERKSWTIWLQELSTYGEWQDTERFYKL